MRICENVFFRLLFESCLGQKLLPYPLLRSHGYFNLQGAKLLHGHIPLYKSGLDSDAKRFSSLHGVQRHMIDSNKWVMLFEGNEEEYEDYYDFSWSDDEAGK